MNKKPRPTSITVIAWLLIVGSVIFQMSCLLKLHIHVGPYTIMIFNIVCAIAILQGQDWGRYVYAIGGAIPFVINLVTSPIPINRIFISQPVIFIIMMIVLFRSRANEYFSADRAVSDTFVQPPKDKTEKLDTKKITPIIGIVIGAICLAVIVLFPTQSSGYRILSFIKSAERVEFKKILYPSQKIVIDDTEVIRKFVTGVTLQTEWPPCLCGHLDQITFYKGNEKLVASTCDHCFDVTLDGKLKFYYMPPELRTRFENAQSEHLEQEVPGN